MKTITREKPILRELEEIHEDEVFEMDEESGFYVVDWIGTGMAYGYFINDELIGYMTLGYADFCGEDIDNHPLHTNDSLMLSNVYIKEEYRGRGYGHKMIEEAIKDEKESMYLNFLDEWLQEYYEKIGFERFGDDYSMHRRNKQEPV